jgi:hypothetical protein
MKLRAAFLGLTALFLLVVAGHDVRALAQEQAWDGEISDATCGRSHLRMSQGLFTAPECVVACVEKVKYVLVTKDKIFEIANQDHAGLKEHPGEPVKVTGELKMDEVVIAKVEVTK